MFAVWKWSYQTCYEILVNNWSTTAIQMTFFASVDCIESERTASPAFLLPPIFPHPRPPQRILCSTSALAMFEPGLGSCCRLDWGERGMEGWAVGRGWGGENTGRKKCKETQIKYSFRLEPPENAHHTHHQCQRQQQWGLMILLTDWITLLYFCKTFSRVWKLINR